MPHVRRRRDEIFQNSKLSSFRIVHYTSAESALKIIKSKRLWMRSAACMSDYREVQHGHDMLLKYFNDQGNYKAFTEAVDVVAPGAAIRAIANFDKYWNSGTILYQTYISSVSEHQDIEDLDGRLSMWRAYGGNSAHVALVFHCPAQSDGAEAMKLIFSPITYLETEEANLLIPEIIGEIQANYELLKSIENQVISNWIFNMLLTIVTCVKHSGFREEREWRVVYCPNLFHSEFIKPTTETISGVPQVVYNLPLDKTLNASLEDLDFTKLFDRVIIGPTQYAMPITNAFLAELKMAGVPEAQKKILISHIPIRS